MKERELSQHTDCDVCGKKVGASGLPLFSTLKLKRWGLRLDAIRRQDGLSAFLGSNVLAGVMGLDEDVATVVSEYDATVCETCLVGDVVNLMALCERVAEREVTE